MTSELDAVKVLVDSPVSMVTICMCIAAIMALTYMMMMMVTTLNKRRTKPYGRNSHEGIKLCTIYELLLRYFKL